ncbi:MAG: hypothetical protein PHC52_09775 [Syntrophales bacterium]|nr:hypothetical protein [Syntrophales bacterium]
MAYTAQELIDEVKIRCGRTGDAETVTDARVLQWLNDAQEVICENVPGLPALQMKNTTSVDTTQVLQYALSEWTSPLDDVTTESRICQIWGLYYVNGSESQAIQFMSNPRFDAYRIDPTHSDFGFGMPEYWTRRGGYIEMVPLSACDYCDQDLRLDGQVYPPDFTTGSTESSALDRADEGLILYATAQAWSIIGGATGDVQHGVYLQKFSRWLEDYRFQSNNWREWDLNIYGLEAE